MGEAGLRARRVLPWILVGLLCAVPVIVPGLGMPSLLGLATRIVIMGLAASSLNLLLGYGGLVSFGHAAYFGLGAYTVGILNAQFVSGDPLFGVIAGTNQLVLTLPAAMLVSGLVALVLGALCLRTVGVPFIMITLAFAQMLYFLFVSLKAYGGDDGLLIRRPNVLASLNLRDGATMYWIAAVCLVAYLGVSGRAMRARFGRVIAGQRQSERRMAALGIATYPYKLVLFVMAGMGAGLAGALMANFSRFVSPDMMHWTQSGDLLIMVVIGGGGRLFGPLLGAAVLIGLETLLSGWTQYWQIVMGPILVLVALGGPGLRQRIGWAA
jgi:branched-chain amino acid transport system permease protein